MRTRPGSHDCRTRTVCGTTGLLAAILAGCALAGCTTARPPAATAARPATQGASARVTTSGATGNTGITAAKPSPSPRQRATADADAIFASFAVPPGARELASAPDLGGASGRMLAQARPSQTDVVYTGGWWEAPGRPRAVLTWEQAHVSTGLSQADGLRETARGMPVISYDLFSLPSVQGLLDDRSLLVQAVAAGDQTLIRVDAQVMWNPFSPATRWCPLASKIRMGRSC